MTNTSHLPPKERVALSRLRQLLSEPGLLRGSWVKMTNTCGKSTCRCATSKRNRHISWYVTQSKDGKARSKCVPKERQTEVRAWLARCAEARILIERISDCYWERLGKGRKK